ncbi:MAG: DUF1223 domain-containing protein [Bryobacteraceae bacterium]
MNIAVKDLAALAVLTVLLPVVSGENSDARSRSGRVPVLLELFTSEGCSSCPPADKLLQELDRNQPIEGADLIVLSEHVDYWNHLGWADPSSSPTFTKRQQDYATRLGSDDVYTPQLVVDGAASLVGSDWPKAEIAIKEALGRVKLPVDVTAEENKGAARIHIEIGPNSGKQAGAVYLAMAYDHARSQVPRGENAGRALTHVAVAYSLQKVATIEPNLAFKKDLQISVPPNSRPGETRIIVFVQGSGTPRIIGAAQRRL